MSLLRVPDRTLNVLEEIGDERLRQDRKWGEQNHDLALWMVILMEEVGEAAKAVFEKSAQEYRGELIQIAAVAASAVESFDRQARREPYDQLSGQ